MIRPAVPVDTGQPISVSKRRNGRDRAIGTYTSLGPDSVFSWYSGYVAASYYGHHRVIAIARLVSICPGWLEFRSVPQEQTPPLAGAIDRPDRRYLSVLGRTCAFRYVMSGNAPFCRRSICESAVEPYYSSP